VIGVGNPEGGDDGAGRLVARRLRELCRRAPAAGPVVRECTGEATALMEAWAGFDDVVLVDACRGAGEPGSLHSFGAHDLGRLASLQPLRRGSTHGLGVSAAIALARALGRLPRGLVVHAIEGRRFAAGEPPSAEVERAAHELAARLARRRPPRARRTGSPSQAR
jgi:hydrogenase maturation protease